MIVETLPRRDDKRLGGGDVRCARTSSLELTHAGVALVGLVRVLAEARVKLEAPGGPRSKRQWHVEARVKGLYAPCT
jgi:hypothetical protein